MSLRVNQRLERGVAILELDGRLVLGEDQVLMHAVKSLVAGGTLRIVLDLSRIAHVDSAGIGTLVSSFTTVTSAGGRLVLAGLQKRVSDLLSVTKLISVFETYPTADEAAAALQNDQR